jgi:hypothetical protein
MLRGPVGTEVHLKFLETRQVKLNMERCVFMNDGTPSVGIRWRNGLSEMIVEGMLPGYQGFGKCTSWPRRLVVYCSQSSRSHHCVYRWNAESRGQVVEHRGGVYRAYA